MNGDGHLDLVTAIQSVPVDGDLGTRNYVEVLLGNGDGTFPTRPNDTRLAVTTRFAAGKGSPSITVSDLDGDGNPDLITANSESNDVSILLSNR